MRPEKKEIYSLIQTLARLDYNEPVPEMNALMISVWGEHYRHIAALVPETIKGGKVLEIGIGYGVLAVLLKEFYSCSVVATEHPSRGYLRSSEFIQFMNKKGINIVEHELHQPLPFIDNTFDMVSYCDVIEHLPQSMIDGSLREIRRVLKPGGCLLLSTPNLARFPNRLRFLLGRAINPPFNPRKMGETYDHIREFTEDEIKKLFGGDFHILKHGYGLIPFFNERFNLANSLLFRIYPKCGDEIYILAKVIKDGCVDGSTGIKG